MYQYFYNLLLLVFDFANQFLNFFYSRVKEIAIIVLISISTILYNLA